MDNLCVKLAIFAALLAVSACHHPVVRTYYIAARETQWDYTPSDPRGPVMRNAVPNKPQDRIGSVYHKVAYFPYTDQTFSKEAPKPKSMGIIGPVITGEVNDVIVVHFFNNASRPFSIHPHGVLYEKAGEGALYLDGTSKDKKLDDGVQPGEVYVYRWRVSENNAPTDEDPDCLPWVYHSHVNSVRDVYSGLLGVIVTCKKGTLNKFNRRIDVDEDFPILVMNWNENLSWYYESNMKKFCPQPSACQKLSAAGDQGFFDSNIKKSVNGMANGTLPGIQACVGDRVVFYVIGFGSESDVHSIHFHGQNMHHEGARDDTVTVYSATFVAAQTTPTISGTWKISDMVGNNEQEGIMAKYSVQDCKRNRGAGAARARMYYLAANEDMWNYAPSGRDDRTGKFADSVDKLKSDTFQANHIQRYFWEKYGTAFLTDWRRLHTEFYRFYENPCDKHCASHDVLYRKAKFVEYSDENFASPVHRSVHESHMGILGPVIGAEVGDQLFVTLKNNIRFPVTFLPHGLTYDQSEEPLDGPGLSGVQPNKTHVYRFDVPEGLLEGSPLPCKSFLYTSSHDLVKDRNAGLVGPLLICKKGYLTRKDERPSEFFILVSTIDEEKSLFSEINSVKSTELKFNINGYIFGNLPGLELCLDEEVIWYVMALGSEIDLHTVTFDGNTFNEGGMHRDGRPLAPGNTAALSMVPDNEGRWMLYSHSNLAMDNGMFAFYRVHRCDGYAGRGKTRKGVSREYFIAADEVYWDYTPLPRSIITGADLTKNSTPGSIYFRHDEYYIGHIYKKAIYREYTDSSFKSLKSVGRNDILGPVMMAEVGDTLRVNFRNNASRPYSMHTHGLWTRQESSGVNYGFSFGVLPGRTFQYVWSIPERAGPGPNDPNCIPWLYFSSVDTTKDTNSGLLGPLIVCRKGTLDKSGKRKDVDKELFIYMSVMNENLSWYLKDNIKKFAPNRMGTPYQNDSSFTESNMMHAINGRVHGNNKEMVIEYGQRVAWYMMALGAEIDLHTIHLHGHTFVHSSKKHRDDVIQIFPGMAEAVEMIADNPGTWLLHCHVNDHIFAGMETVYTVREPKYQR